MKKKVKCIICESERTDVIPTEVCYFVAERISCKNLKTVFIHCKNCGFAFYDYRLTDEEIKDLYSGYRNDFYQQQRQKYEPFYTKEINELIGKSETEIKNRKANLETILKRNVSVDSLKSVLDFGGDSGVFIPDCFHNVPKTVFEISGTQTVENIRLINKIEELKKEKFDFIMCAHVLEHVNSPFETIQTIKECLNPGGYCYVELPFDSAFYAHPFSNLQFLLNKYFHLQTLFGGSLESPKNRIRFLMHEHINYFSPDSIKHLLKKEGFKIVTAKTKLIDCGWVKARVICVLAKLY